MNKLIIILGPTASGKTSLAVSIANKYNGEIISADSRQIYKGMDIGTGKDLDEYIVNNQKIKYHLIDILHPSKDYSVFQFKNDFYPIYDQLIVNKKNPILCGGTGLYLESILLNYDMPTIGPNPILRKKLEKLSMKDLENILKDLDYEIFDQSFHITKRRLIRSIEIIHPENQNKNNSLIDRSIHNPLIIGLKIERSNLLENIKKRLFFRLENGLIEEVENLIKNGMTLERLSYFGLEYKFAGKFLFDEILYNEMTEKLNVAINRFSKKQMTFFRRMEKRGLVINWMEPNEVYEKIKSIN